MTAASELLPIGRFARACRLSIKALRHYDELGLLRPARVDASNYRYYRRSQARDAIAISLLRSLGVPLATIKAILAERTPADVAASLGGERTRIERELARSRRALCCVERMIRDGDVMPHTVSLRDEPGCRLLVVEATTLPELHVEVGYDLFARLRALLTTLQLPLAEPVTCLLPEPPDDDSMILQMGTPIAADIIIDADILRRHDAAIVELPAAPFAFVTHRGPYEELGIAQHAVTAWTHAHGRPPAGAMREIYRNDPKQVADADILTEVGIPLVP
jgi:DNA-binding transcriptional MerR regulator